MTRVQTHTTILLSAALTCAVSAQAAAHVKWFAPYDVATTPRLLTRVVDSDFVGLTLLAIAVMLVGCVIDRTRAGAIVSRSLDRIVAPLAARADELIRATCGFFLISIWAVGGILMTPELKTASPSIAALHLTMAAALLTRRTAIVTATGIVVLYSVGIWQYGLFHLLDYPIFLGVALYLADLSLSFCARLKIAPNDLIRWAASITLMWASIEKWAYPQWTMPLYVQHPDMSLGYDFNLFMCAAGVIEFTLAFCLLLTPLVRRSAAFILLGVFIGATFDFGKVDVIGHAVIIAVLLVIASDPVRPRTVSQPWRWVAEPTAAYAMALAVFMSLYYGLHSILFLGSATS